MRIAIVGAGIGGLTTALALARPGREIVVHERRTGFGETGAGIQLSPNASRILIGLGLGGSLARLAAEPEQVVIRSLRTGRAVGGVALGARMRERHGAPYWQVARADLHTALLDAVRSRPEVRLRMGRALVGLDDGPAGVDLTTETASGARGAATFDLAIGADGLWSPTRALLGDTRRPRPSGYAAFRASAPCDRAPPELASGETGLWLGPGEHLVHYPVAGGRFVNLVWVRPSAAAGESWSAAVQAAPSADRLPPPLRGLVDAAGSWWSWSLHDLPARSLGGGRVALVGDSGHPVLPFLAQGGALAIEDAAALVAILKDGGDVPAGLARWRRERLSRVRRVQAAARRNGRAYHAGWPVSAVRDAVMRRLGPDGMADRYDWLYGWRPPAP